MDPYITGSVIRELREARHMTQSQLAGELHISDKAISKWETGKGYPDITLLQPLAKAFGVSITELLAGNAVKNKNVASHMLRSQLYVCPVCGNVLHSMGEAVITCHGLRLAPCEAEAADDAHRICIEHVEHEYFISIEHDMTKEHYISFIAAVSADRMQMVKLYPEGPAQTRVQRSGVERILFYCNHDGLFSVPVKQLRKR